MKIAILDIDNLKNPHWGSGQAKVTHEIGKRLAKDSSVTVYSSKYPGYKDYISEGITYKHIGIGTNNQYINNIAYIISSLLLVSRIKDDIIVENFTAPFSTSLVPFFTKTPVVGLGSFFAADKLSAKYHLPFYVFEKIFSKFYQNFIALNGVDEQKMRKLNKKTHTIVIANGVEDEVFTMKTSEKQYILFFGRIDINQKGLDLLLQAYKQISGIVKDKLFILGKGDNHEEEKLRNLIQSNHLTDKVFLIGKKERKDALRIVSKCKIVVMPSRYEGHSLSALESLALGKPLICFDIPGFSWVGKKIAIKVKPFDKKELAKNMLKLLQSKTLRARFKIASKKFARQFTWNNSAKYYNDFLTEIYLHNV